ncbi:hypothetical protein GCM10009838_84540 [Catenulispora subtropica]|uniref:Secreted protein n=1 Tax=Catenulispora subtropica TaxID=450798 RepID=A0ABP5ER16_9ACTN
MPAARAVGVTAAAARVLTALALTVAASGSAAHPFPAAAGRRRRTLTHRDPLPLRPPPRLPARRPDRSGCSGRPPRMFAAMPRLVAGCAPIVGKSYRPGPVRAQHPWQRPR